MEPAHFLVLVFGIGMLHAGKTLLAKHLRNRREERLAGIRVKGIADGLAALVSSQKADLKRWEILNSAIKATRNGSPR